MVKQTLPLLLICVMLGLLAGVVLGGMKASLEALPGLLVLVPAILATRGNIFGAFGSRLGSALHQGLIRPELKRDNNLMHSITAALGEGVIMSIVVAVIAHYVILALGRDSIGIIPLTAISLIAGVVSGIVLTVLILVLAFAGYRRGIDPDNITGPIATTVGDLLAMLALFMAAEVVLRVI
ncbi:magnesium transporter [Candidatus Pacearchaeota archaeon]|nr:magnesium transporter [Candidatus Pacearchaeota archaeon]